MKIVGIDFGTAACSIAATRDRVARHDLRWD